MSDEAVTIVIKRAVRGGCERDFEAAVAAWIPRSLAFPGHLGVHMLRPPEGGNEYGAVLKFRTRHEWEELQASSDYAQFLENVQRFLEDQPAVETVSGLESWFTPLGSRVVTVPPRWKMALVTWLAVCVTVYAVQQLFVPWLLTLPAILTFILSNGLVVAGLTWLVMPLFSRWFRSWLAPSHSRHRSNLRMESARSISPSEA